LDINFGTGGTPAALATHFLQQQEKNSSAIRVRIVLNHPLEKSYAYVITIWSNTNLSRSKKSYSVGSANSRFFSKKDKIS
jgi:hypothetical protein